MGLGMSLARGAQGHFIVSSRSQSSVQILQSMLPYAHLSRDSAIIRSLVIGTPPADTQNLKVSNEIKVLLGSCWATDPTLRPSIEECSVVLRALIPGYVHAPLGYLALFDIIRCSRSSQPASNAPEKTQSR